MSMNIKSKYPWKCKNPSTQYQVELAQRRAAARKAKLKAREKAPAVEGKWEKDQDFFTGQEHIPIMNKGEDSHVFEGEYIEARMKV